MGVTKSSCDNKATAGFNRTFWRVGFWGGHATKDGEMTIWLTSDLHLGHRAIINYCRRPFSDENNMNKLLAQQWNEVVQDHDTVYVLGDFAMGKITETLPLAEGLKGNKLLVPGNHDRCWTGHSEKKRRGWTEKYEDVGFTILENQVWLEDILLCHFPPSGDSHPDDRYDDHRPIDSGELILHGHVHDTWKQRGNWINVGVDVWGYYPVAFETLLELANA